MSLSVISHQWCRCGTISVGGLFCISSLSFLTVFSFIKRQKCDKCRKLLDRAGCGKSKSRRVQRCVSWSVLQRHRASAKQNRICHLNPLVYSFYGQRKTTSQLDFVSVCSAARAGQTKHFPRRDPSVLTTIQPALFVYKLIIRHQYSPGLVV